MSMCGVQAVREALETGCSVRAAAGTVGRRGAWSSTTGLAPWSHADLSVDVLKPALSELESFPKPTDESKALGKQGNIVMQLRMALMKADWNSAASWKPVSDALSTRTIAESMCTRAKGGVVTGVASAGGRLLIWCVSCLLSGAPCIRVARVAQSGLSGYGLV